MAAVSVASDQTLVEDCGAVDIEDVVRSMFESYGDGDVAAAVAWFAEEPAFEWFSAPPDRQEGAEWDPYDRSSLESYFAFKHAGGERIQVDGVTFNGVRGGYGNFSMQLTRLAAERGEIGPFFGKGAIDCAVGLIAVMSLGEPGA